MKQERQAKDRYWLLHVGANSAWPNCQHVTQLEQEPQPDHFDQHEHGEGIYRLEKFGGVISVLTRCTSEKAKLLAVMSLMRMFCSREHHIPPTERIGNSGLVEIR